MELRQLPSIDELLNTAEVAALCDEHDREMVASAAREVVDEIRGLILSGAGESIRIESIPGRIVERVGEKFRPSIRRAINAAGIVLHTGLGRAVMPKEALDAVLDVSRGYCNLATDDDNKRATRDRHYDSLLKELTGAEAATIVNNNAAATMLILNTLAQGKEVIVSRGQLVEIGGAFRMPDVMAMSGAVLREVGTTNKTHLRDYAAAINENTGAILHVHMSNYRIVGFFEEPGVEELAKLAHDHNLPLIDDIGSGALVDLTPYGVEKEPMVTESIKAGTDVACFSGDKLIGGPQSGIIIGRADLISSIKKNPLARAMRISKMEVAALEATLKLFLDPSKLNSRHPIYRMLSMSVEEIDARARTMLDALAGKIDAEVTVIDGSSQVGSGSVPAEMLPTRLLSVRPMKISADALARRLRTRLVPIFTRIQQDAVLFDPRTLLEGEDGEVLEALKDAMVGG